MASQAPDKVRKIIVLGNAGVGKTSLLLRYTENSFSSEYIPTIGVDFRVKTVQSTKLQIWDTAGQERFRSITSSYYRGAQAIILVYNVANKDSYTAIEQVWLNDLERLGTENAVKVLVGTQTDSTQRTVTAQEAEALCAKHGMSHVEATAKDGKNIDTIFQLVVNKLDMQDNNMRESAPQRTDRSAPSSTTATATAAASAAAVKTNSPSRTVQQDPDCVKRLLLIGDAACGKSSLLLQYTDSVFSESYISTIGVDFKIRTLQVHGQTIKLQIWDTAGQERFRTITSSYYRGTNGVFVVYDITNKESFDAIKTTWLAEIDRYSNLEVVRIIIGTKCDLDKQRAVSTAEAQEFSKSLGLKHFEASAKENKGVEAAFLAMVEELLKADRNPDGSFGRNQQRAPAAAPPRSRSCILL